MAPKRALRSASRLDVVSATQPARKFSKDFISTSKVLPQAQNLNVASAPARHDLAESSPTTPIKRRKIESREVDLKNLSPYPDLLNRPAGPHSTNAPLKTPRGSKLVAYPQEVLDSSPLWTGIPRPTTSTKHLLEQACAHLTKADPRMQSLVDKHPCRLFSPDGLAEEVDPFQSLCSGIMAQQVSGAAAKSIKAKFINLFRDSTEGSGNKDESSSHIREEESFFPSPNQVAPCDLSYLRKAGLSARKAEYIKGLAEKFVARELTAASLIQASDEEIIEKLTSVRGLGLWSAQMFACFALKRMDIFSTGRDHHSQVQGTSG